MSGRRVSVGSWGAPLAVRIQPGLALFDRHHIIIIILFYVLS